MAIQHWLIHLIKYRWLKRKRKGNCTWFFIWPTPLDPFLILVKSHVTDQRVYDEMPVPTISERPVKGLSRLYDEKHIGTGQFELLAGSIFYIKHQ